MVRDDILNAGVAGMRCLNDGGVICCVDIWKGSVAALAVFWLMSFHNPMVSTVDKTSPRLPAIKPPL